MNFSQLRARLIRLGYGLQRNVTDCMGKRWAFGTYPDAGSGSHNFFTCIAHVERYCIQVEETRSLIGD